MAPCDSSPPAASSPAATALTWSWALDEAAIREDGGAGDLAIAVDAGIASQHAYTPPAAVYEQTLWEATRTSHDDSSPPAQLTPSAGWIVPRVKGPLPLFVAHTMLSAVWLLRQSLPDHLVDDGAWLQLTQAAAAVELAAAPTAARDGPSRSTSPERPAKRARVASHVTPPVEEEHASETAVATVSNHNRRAERARKARRIKAGERRQESLGLIVPSSQAPVAERNAHRSITPQDEPTVAWIVKQPLGVGDFFHAAKQPYATAETMIRYARAVGNETAKMQAARFVQNWRRTGHALLPGTSSSALVSCTQPSPLDITMEAITGCETVMATVGPVYRWGMATLCQQYHDEIASIQEADKAAGLQSGRRDGDGPVRTQAKNNLWARNQTSISRPAFNARLKRSHRWLEAAQRLGWGFLLLMPSDTITPHWVEQTLRVPEWHLWLQLVGRVNAEAVQASRDFDNWAGPRALQGGSIQGVGRLQLEARFESRIHEVLNSSDEGESDMASDDGGDAEGDSGDGPGGGVSLGMARRSPTPVASHMALLRSLDLRELFRPAGVEESCQSEAEP